MRAYLYLSFLYATYIKCVHLCNGLLVRIDSTGLAARRQDPGPPSRPPRPLHPPGWVGLDS